MASEEKSGIDGSKVSDTESLRKASLEGSLNGQTPLVRQLKNRHIAMIRHAFPLSEQS
jgi:amino acid permease